ncbi:MAG: hypothetical protein ACI9LV_001006 [Candidatus Nanohaloarchaea archaeon]|jgi:hypothetical protein
MKKTATLILTLIVSTGVALGHPFTMDMLNQQNTEHLQEETNIYAENVPQFLGSLVGDQTINARIVSNNTTKKVGVKMNGTNIQEIQMETYSDATLEINTSEKQIRNITMSDQPIQTLNQKLKNGKIEYDTNGAVNSLRTYIAEQLLSLSTLI